MLVWQNYQTDLGRIYPMFSLSAIQVNDVPTNIEAIALLPTAIASQLRKVKSSCGVDGLTPRQLSLFTNDGANFLLSYPLPFSQNLAEYLILNSEVTAYEFIGERLKYGRLKRLLDNVS